LEKAILRKKDIGFLKQDHANVNSKGINNSDKLSENAQCSVAFSKRETARQDGVALSQ
jgi:hypothetical protein